MFVCVAICAFIKKKKETFFTYLHLLYVCMFSLFLSLQLFLYIYSGFILVITLAWYVTFFCKQLQSGGHCFFVLQLQVRVSVVVLYGWFYCCAFLCFVVYFPYSSKSFWCVLGNLSLQLCQCKYIYIYMYVALWLFIFTIPTLLIMKLDTENTIFQYRPEIRKLLELLNG